jgi:ribonucleoside-triphosphate reductase
MQDLQQLTMFSRYSRLEEKGNLSTWEDVVNTCFDMYVSRTPTELLDELEVARQLTISRVLFPSGRCLQFAGTPIEKVNARLYNCVGAFAIQPDILWKSFFLLLCGCGVGLSVQKHHVNNLPDVTLPVGDNWTFMIPDSIQGWADGLKHLLMSYFMEDAPPVEFSYLAIRKKGEPISVLLGKAPGPDPLHLALDKVRTLLNTVETTKLTPLNVFDIMAYMSDAVLAGGVRRSAMLMLFSEDDMEMMKCKTGNWFIENPQRARANISALMLRSELTEEKIHITLETTRQFGEPGFIFANSTETCVNPCAEVSFSPWLVDDNGERKYGFSVCNLVEVAVPHCETVEHFLQAQSAAALVATIQASYTSFPYLGVVTEEIVRRDALTGGSLTGILEKPEIGLDPSILQKAARVFMETNKRVADIMGINPAVRALVVKPSGTAAIMLQLAGSGIHPPHSEQYIRRVQIGHDTDISRFYRKHRPHAVEKSVWAPDTDVISFAIDVRPGARTKDNVGALELLKIVKVVKENWIDQGHRAHLQPFGFKETNNVSLTVNIADNMWGAVGTHLYQNSQTFTGVACLSNSGDTTYQQAPFQHIMSAQALFTEFGASALRDVFEFEANPFKPLDEGPMIDFAKEHFGGDISIACECYKHSHARQKFLIIEACEHIPWEDMVISREDMEKHLESRGESSCAGDGCVLRQF